MGTISCLYVKNKKIISLENFQLYSDSGYNVLSFGAKVAYNKEVATLHRNWFTQLTVVHRFYCSMWGHNLCTNFFLRDLGKCSSCVISEGLASFDQRYVNLIVIISLW